AVGALLLLDNADVLDAGDVIGTWWPAVLILAGILTFAANPPHWPVALIITAIGAAFLLSRLDIVDVGDIVIPAAIILVGLLVIFGRGLGSRTEIGDRINSFNVFSGSELASHSKVFSGGSVSAVVVAPDAPILAINATVLFGGLGIKH
ncbi:MAG: LiaF transmembrane domain-containing protein, partial [Acidimicrobiia bacterium]